VLRNRDIESPASGLKIGRWPVTNFASMGWGDTVKLYSYFRSSAAYRVRIAFNLKDLAFETVPIHLQKEGGQNLKPDYRAIKPQMRVPALKLNTGE
jgi:hypothetical protein